MIGGVLQKGISGGEKKRTSIGYELITDPNLVLCDEPTSGLDSSTAFRIVQMLKKEAISRNLTIICTIHSPSAEIFQSFDRLLLLQDGYQIYQGPIRGIPTYLEEKLGCPIKKFSNPSDFLLRMAQQPQTVSADLTLQKMIF